LYKTVKKYSVYKICLGGKINILEITWRLEFHSWRLTFILILHQDLSLNFFTINNILVEERKCDVLEECCVKFALFSVAKAILQRHAIKLKEVAWCIAQLVILWKHFVYNHTSTSTISPVSVRPIKQRCHASAKINRHDIFAKRKTLNAEGVSFRGPLTDSAYHFVAVTSRSGWIEKPNQQNKLSIPEAGPMK